MHAGVDFLRTLVTDDLRLLVQQLMVYPETHHALTAAAVGVASVYGRVPTNQIFIESACNNFVIRRTQVQVQVQATTRPTYYFWMLRGGRAATTYTTSSTVGITPLLN